MKILHIINSLCTGGAEKLLVDMIPLQRHQENDEISILLLCDSGSEFISSLKRSEINVQSSKYSRLTDPRNVAYLTNFIKSGSFDIVHTHLFPAQLWVSIAAKSLHKNTQVKFVTTEHSTYNWRRKFVFFRVIDRMIYRNFDSIVSISSETQTLLAQWLGQQYTDNLQMSVIQNGVDIKKISLASAYRRNQLVDNIDSSCKMIFMAGRFVDAKDQRTLISAMMQLPNEYHLVFAGNGPTLNDHILLVQESKLADRVHFLGFRNDIARILKTVDLVVQSSNYEGFGIAAVEGMAAGKPILASNVDGLASVIGNDDYLFEKGNAKQLANKIFDILSDNGKYSLGCKYSAERARLFDITKTAESYRSLYIKLMDKVLGE